MTVVDGSGELPPVSPEDLAALRAAAPKPKRTLAAAPSSKAELSEDARLRRYCLEIAAKGGGKTSAEILEAARQFQTFVLEG